MHFMPGEAKTASSLGTTSRTTGKTPIQLAWSDDHVKVRMHAILHSTKLWVNSMQLSQVLKLL